MIREPYGVYPYNSTIDTDTVENFSFIFNGDQLRKYDYEILENNNKKNKIKSFSNLISLGKTVYNDETVNFHPTVFNNNAQNKNLIWRLRLVENEGNWIGNDIPTMKIQTGYTDEIINGHTIKGKITGSLEQLSTEDLQEVAVSLKTKDNSIFRVKNYESRYYEYYTLGKGGYYVGEVISTGQTDKYYWVERTSTQGGQAKKTWVTRSSVNSQPVLLKDATGIYSIDNLFTQTEFNNIFANSTVSYSKERFLSDYTVKVLQSFGYNETPQAVYHVNSITNSKGQNYSNRITRQSVGLAQNIYLKYRKASSDDYTEKAFDDVFTEAEANALKNYSISFRMENSGDKIGRSYTEVTEVTFNEQDEILYSVDENLLNYGSILLSQYKAGTIDNYPKETTEPLQRKTKFPKKTSILLKDQSGNIFSSEYLFTKNEIDQIEDENYGLYDLVTFQGTVANITKLTDFAIYKNFYDSNYYYFQSRPTPQITFVDENGKELIYEYGMLNIDGRYYSFGIKDQDKINTKYYFWTLYRDDQIEPTTVTKKTFSQNVKFTYDNFLNDYTYTLVLTLETQDGGIYSYDLPNIVVKYDETVQAASKASASYHPADGFTTITWPTQRLSIPTIIPPDGYRPSQNWIDGKGKPLAIDIDKGTSLTYDNLAGDTLKIDPNRFIVSACFSIPEKVINNNLSSFDILKLTSSVEDNSFLTLRKTGLELRIITSNTEEQGVKFREIDINSVGNSFKNKFFNFLNEIKAFALQTSYTKENNYYNNFIIPDSSEPLKDSSYYLYATDTDLIKSRYKIFIAREGAFLVKFTYNQSTGWTATSYYAIDNTDNKYHYEIKDAYFRKIQIFGKSIFKYLIVYNYSNIENLIKYKEHGCLDLNWSPSWDNDPEGKIISIDYAEGVKSSYNADYNGAIKSYRIYRSEYSDASQKTLINNKLIAEFNAADLVKINNNSSYIIKDYSVHNRGYFVYSITPRIEVKDESDETITKVLGVSINSNIVYTDEYYWFFISLGKRQDGTYAPLEKWNFYLNLNEAQITHNTQKVFHTGFSPYPKASVGTTNYITTQFSCLVGNFFYQKNYSYDGLHQFTSELTRITDKNNMTRLYIKETPQLENLNIEKDNVTICMRGQNRTVTNYGVFYENGMRFFYIDINSPFVDFIPGFKYKTYTLTIVKDKNNKNNFAKTGEYNEYVDNIDIINNWNAFAATDNPILIKDIKGNCFIGVISNNTESYNSQIGQMPTTINFTVTQVDDVNDYIIFDY